jgi:hypothetical protein
VAAPTTARRPAPNTTRHAQPRARVSPEPRRAAPRPPLRLVNDARLKAAHRRRRARFVVVLAAVVAAGSLFLLAAFNAMLVTGQARIDHLQKQVAEAQTQYSANRLKVAELEAPSHVVAVAQQRLGMVPPHDVTYLAPSEAMAAQVEHGTGATPTTTASGKSTTKSDGGTSWAAVKPYLGGRP